MVRTVNHSQATACPFAQGDGGRHTNWGTARDPVSNLHCGGPVSNMQAHQTPLQQQYSGVAARAPAAYSNPAATHGDALDAFAQKTQRDIVYEAKRQAHAQRTASRGGGVGRGAGAEAVQPRRQQQAPYDFGQPPPHTGMSHQSGPPQTGQSNQSNLDFGSNQDKQIVHGRRKSTIGESSGVSGMFGNAQAPSMKQDIQQGRRKSEEKVTAQWMQEAERGLAPSSHGGGGIACHGSNCSSGGYRVMQPSGGASSLMLG